MTDYGTLLDKKGFHDPILEIFNSKKDEIELATYNNSRSNICKILFDMAGIVLFLNVNRHVFKEFTSHGYGVTILHTIFEFNNQEEARYGNMFRPLELNYDSIIFNSAGGTIYSKKYVDISIEALLILARNYNNAVTVILRDIWMIEKSAREAKILADWISEITNAGCTGISINSAHS